MNTYQPDDQTTWPCPRCQAAIPSTSVFCPSCGLQLVQQPSPGAQQPAKKSSGGNAALGVLVLIVLGAGFWYVFLRGPSSPTSPPGDRPSTSRPAATAPAGPSLTRAQQNARDSAESYLSFSAFSRSGLIDQLVFEEYSRPDATAAVDSLRVDWREQAYKSAKSYLDFQSFSLSGLIDQLEFEGFSTAEATYGANKAYDE